MSSIVNAKQVLRNMVKRRSGTRFAQLADRTDIAVERLRAFQHGKKQLSVPELQRLSKTITHGYAEYHEGTDTLTSCVHQSLRRDG